MFDVLADLAGVRSYEDLRRDATIEEVEGHRIRVASLSHLIAMKRAANRPKDKLMLLEYIVFADERSGRGEGGGGLGGLGAGAGQRRSPPRPRDLDRVAGVQDLAALFADAAIADVAAADPCG